MAKFFAASSEFRSRYGTLDDAGFVDRLYLNVLGRPSDPSGRQYWVGRLQSGAMTRGEVLSRFARSPEHRVRRWAAATVAIAYVAILDRQSDPSGLAYWSGRLRAGAPTRDVLAAFSRSPGAVL
ncbi:MAG: DUF4214 domain-containing protein [Iamia sp.]